MKWNCLHYASVIGQALGICHQDSISSVDKGAAVLQIRKGSEFKSFAESLLVIISDFKVCDVFIVRVRCYAIVRHKRPLNYSHCFFSVITSFCSFAFCLKKQTDFRHLEGFANCLKTMDLQKNCLKKCTSWRILTLVFALSWSKIFVKSCPICLTVSAFISFVSIIGIAELCICFFFHLFRLPPCIRINVLQVFTHVR